MESGFKTGRNESTLDDKGRVVIPSQFRERFAEDVKIVEGQEQCVVKILQGKEQCVWVMTQRSYAYFVKTVKNELIEKGVSEEIENFEYQHESTAEDAKVDLKNGRIPIPSSLRAYANLSKDCLVVSIKGRLEIWNADYNKTFMEEVRLKNKATLSRIDGKVNYFLEEKA